MTKSEFLAQAQFALDLALPGKELKPHQREVLAALAEGQNVFAALPTGYGKSLCYWLPSLAWRWRIWVLSPLVSLMEDQRIACAEAGVRAVAVHANSRRNENELLSYDWEIVFLSPERLERWWENGLGRELCDAGLGPDLLVLDEMHCFEDWRDFRNGYQQAFAAIRELVGGGAQLLGLSASFRESESRAWMGEFCDQHLRVAGPLARENLSLFVLPLEEGYWRWLFLAAFLRDLEAPESALVYCSSRAECDEITAWLQSAGFSATSYHAGLPASLRQERSQAFREGRLRVVCATSAFGMGIDYPHVRRVLHFSLPYDLESYWQEVGRAGRNGEEAWAVALWRRSEIARLRHFDALQFERYASLWRAWTAGGCRKRAVAERLGVVERECGKCDRCRAQNDRYEDLPAWLRDWSTALEELPWWLEPEAQPDSWLAKKNFEYGKALDARASPDSLKK